MSTDPAHGLTVQQADALWDAVAVPGQKEPRFVEQHGRVCRTVADLLGELTAEREQVAVSSAAVPTPPTGQAELRKRIAEALKGVRVWRTVDGCDGWEYAGTDALTEAVAAILLPPTDRAAVLREAAAAIEAEQAREEATAWAQYGELDPETEIAGGVVRASAALLRRLSAEAQQPTDAKVAEAHELALAFTLDGTEKQQTDTQRPRCPHCRLPHDLTPGSMAVRACASILAGFADAERRHAEGDHGGCARVDCEVVRERAAEAETPRRSRAARFLDAVTHSGPGYDLTPAARAEAPGGSPRPVVEHALTAYGYSPDTARALIDRLTAEQGDQ